jgi:acyl transferase domain-containing protein/acyl-CoA synthetase (AMP-forming)/AMP-acid ligase II/NADPH:quinone reductase-like Zn-dependent oxidoreductase/acyl carrier protein
MKTAGGGPRSWRTLSDLVAARAQVEPDAPAISHLLEPDAVSLSLRAFDRRVSQVAYGLGQACTPGDRALIVCASPLEHLIGFLGALRAGVVAVPLNPPHKRRRADRLAGVARNCGARVALGDAATMPDLAERLDDVACLSVETLAAEPATTWRFPARRAEDLAYLQYTSGSTGAPRGVEITHANLLANLADLEQVLAASPTSVMVSWLPLFHDMGLVFGALLPLYVGFPGHLLDPAAVAQDPLRWLRALDRCRATMTGGPNFALDLCVETITDAEAADLDLSSVQRFVCGAEPVRVQSLDRFARKFAPAGFEPRMLRPGYGLAEATLFVSGPGPEEPLSTAWFRRSALATGRVEAAEACGADAVGLVGHGGGGLSTEIMIVDPDTAIACPPDVVGEIWLSGPSVGAGYWGAPEASEATFGARLAGADARSWLRTGDLGFRRDRQLFIAGRLKDLIIVRGINHLPQDIEAAALAAGPDLIGNRAIAVGVEQDGRETVALVAEVKRTSLRALDADAVAAAIRQAVSADHSLALDRIVLIKPGGLPHTSSGKLQRALCRRMLIEESLPVVGEWRRGAPPPPSGDPQDFEAWLQAEAARLLQVAARDIDPDQPLERYGLDSLLAAQLARAISERLQRPVSTVLIYDYPSLAQLRRRLLDAAPPDEAPPAEPRRVADEPVAVIGMACRFPGAPDLGAFRRLLDEGRSGVGPFPAGRLDDLGAFGAALAEGRYPGGYLQEVSGFDPLFFGVSPREAEQMDPQQRLLLEVAWEALEHAGVPGSALAGVQAGVFVGASNVDYRQLLPEGAAPPNGYSGVGSALSILANRLSYFLDLRGPSLTVDTACSSSLVAVHQACMALRRGEAELALAGGVNLILNAELSAVFDHAGMLAPDGRCKTFDAGADGYVRGEGCGMVLLKPLSAALRDGDTVLATILGSAVSQDGRSNGLTAPNGPAQQAVMRRALADADVDATAVGYVETHGTGTALGDPIEVAALRAVYGGDGARPCRLGALKTNIGHLEAAAGVAGLIKAVLTLGAPGVPRNLNFTRLNPEIDLAGSRLSLPDETTPWDEEAGLRHAAVSSFGFGGTNAHLILRGPVVSEGEPAKPAASAPILTLSARTDPALAAVAARWLEAAPSLETDAAAACRASNLGRTHFERRIAVSGASGAELRAGLEAYLAGRTATGLSAFRRETPRAPRIGFLFTGQGALHPGMGQALFETEPTYARALRRCDEIAREAAGLDLLGLMLDPDGDPAALQASAAAQPALFAMGYGLAQMWAAFGVRPHAVLGHSLGAFAAACAAGIIGLEDAMRLVLARGRLMQDLPGDPGAMIAVAADEATILEALESLGGEASLAAVNAPGRVTVSGRSAAIARLAASLRASGVGLQELEVSHGFHSVVMDPMLEAFEARAAQVAPGRGSAVFVSALTGKPHPGEALDASYWRRHAREPVRFHDGLQSLRALGCDTFLELGPRRLLTQFGRQGLPEAGLAWISSLTGTRPDGEDLAAALAGLYAAGVSIDWLPVHGGRKAPRAQLPTYPFQRQRCWRATPATAPSPGLVGRRIDTASDQEAIYGYALSATEPGYIADHRVGGELRVAAAVQLGLVLDAAADLFGTTNLRVEDFLIEEALILSAEAPVRLQLVISRQGGPGHAFTLHAQTDAGGWRRLARGGVRPLTARPASTLDLAAVRAACAEPYPPEALYDRFAALGLDCGPACRSIRNLARGPGEATAEIRLGSEVPAFGRDAVPHPVALDACFQILGSLLPEADDDALFLPVGLAALDVHGSSGRAGFGHARLVEVGAASLLADLRLCDADGGSIAAVTGLKLVKPFARRPAAEPAPALRGVIWEREWIGRPSPIVGASLQVEAVAARAGSSLTEPLVRQTVAQWRDAQPDLEAAAAAYAHAALASLAGDWTPGQRFTETALAARAGIAPQHAGLLHRLLAVLGERGALRQTRDGLSVGDRSIGGWPAGDWPAGDWEVRADAPAKDPSAILERLFARCPGAAAEIALLSRCGQALAEVLTGRRDHLSVLMPESDNTDLLRLYRDSPCGRVLNAAVASAAQAAQDLTPDGRTLRVLEVGGGSGGTTEPVLASLDPQRLEYWFTDISPGFVAHAQRRYGHAPGFVARTLDLEAPAEHGDVPAGGFDVVIAANVVHATADLHRTLSRLHGLLAPGGVILLAEGLAPQAFLDVVFGPLDGWWRFTDKEIRPDYPLIDAQGWKAALAGAGFADACILFPGEASSGANDDRLGHGVILAQRPPTSAAGREGSWLLFGEASQQAECLRTALAGPRRACTLVPLEATASADELGRTVAAACATAGETLAGMVLLRDGDGEPAAGLQAAVEAACAAALALAQQSLAAPAAAPPRVCVVTRGAVVAGRHDSVPGLADAALQGFVRTLALEHPELRPVLVDLDPAGAEDEAGRLAAELLGSDGEVVVAFRGPERLAARLADRSAAATAALVAPAAPFELVATGAGGLEALGLRPAVPRGLAPEEIEIEVAAAGLGFRDLLLAMGRDAAGVAGAPLGGECAGTVSATGAAVIDLQPGDRVLALADAAMADRAIAPRSLVCRLPAKLNFAEAASIPSNFVTAVYALRHIAGLKPGDSVLVHAAAGGTGFAAVQVAQELGARVVGSASPWKFDHLRTAGVTRLVSSRDPGFAEQALALNDGKPFDAVLNCLTGAFIPAGFGLLRPGGTFLELGKSELMTPEEARALRGDVAYRVIDLVSLSHNEPLRVQALLQEVMAGFEAGAYRPAPRTVFPIARAPDAFRQMQRAEHIGKIILETGTADDRPRLDPDGTYLVTGGGGGLGLRVGAWLAERGAGRVVLAGRSPPGAAVTTGFAEIERLGAAAGYVQADMCDEDQAARLVGDIAASGPQLRGVLHLAGVLEDGLVGSQTPQAFARVLRPKTQGAWHLHRLTERLPLDAFVLFSSASALLGSPGQANHAAANAFLDALAQHRRMRGLPGLSIQWGAWSEIGAAVRAGAKRPGRSGIEALPPALGLQLLDRLWNSRSSLVAAAPLRPAALRDDGIWATQAPMFLDPPPASAGRTERSPLFADLPLDRPDVGRATLNERLAGVVAEILGLDPGQRDLAQRGFFELGMDSLTSMELRNTLQRQLGAPLPTTLTFDYPTLEDLTAYLWRQVAAPAGDAGPGPQAAPPPHAAVAARDLEAMSRAEIEAELDRELQMLGADQAAAP